MFFVGIYADPDVTPSVAVFLEFSMKTLKKRYQVREIRRWSNEEGVEIDSEIAAIHADDRYTVMRRVFSQDRRPARNVPTPPTLVMHFSGRDTAPIDRLRLRNIPVEGVAIREKGKWEKEDYNTICLGHNYFVPGPCISAAVAKVVREKRLLIGEDLSQAALWKDMVKRIEPVFMVAEDAGSPGRSVLNTEQRHMLIALSLPIWFRETIQQIRRY
ncbi:MAG: hypothetical protein ACOC3W_05730 [Thermodesulfobacteriota bacterium]